MEKKFRSVYYTSPNQAWTTGGKTKLDFTGFVEVASGGLRVIIDGFELHFQGSLTVADGGGNPLLGPDAWRLFRNITVEQKDGVKRYDEIDGGSMRILNYAVLGPENVRELPNLAVSTATYTASIFVPLMKPKTSHPYDFSMPADVMRQVRIAMAQNADLSLGTPGASTVTINNGVYWVVAVCHLEPRPKLYAVDQVTVMDFQTQLQTTINASGRPHDLLMYVPGPQGGVQLGDVSTALVVDIYDQSRLVYPDLMADYSREQGNEPGLFATTNGSPVKTDPFIALATDTVTFPGDSPRAIALLLSTGNHPDEGPVRENVTVKTTQTANPGVLRLIMREVVPRTQKLDAAQAKKFGATSMTPDRNPADKTVAPKDAAYFPAQLQK